MNRLMTILTFAMWMSGHLAAAQSATTVVSGERLTRAAARAVGVDATWHAAFHIHDVTVVGSHVAVKAQPRTVGDVYRMALVEVSVNGRVVRAVPISFSHSPRPAAARPIAVRSGQHVLVKARHGAVECEMNGTALQEGRVGDTISVRCAAKTIVGRVQTGGEIEVTPK